MKRIYFESEMGMDNKSQPLIVGNTLSTQYIASTGAYQVTYAGGFGDAFLAKFKSTGKLQWATYYGGTEKDGGHAVTADKNNNIFMAGNTYSDNGIASAGSHQTVFGGMMDAYIVKFTPGGVRLWATYLGGEGYGDGSMPYAPDDFGNVYFSGYTSSFTNIATPGAYQQTMNGTDWFSGDVVLGEFTTNGTLRWCTYFSGPGQDRAHSAALDKLGYLYIQGTCESLTDFGTPGVYQSNYGGRAPQDGFIAKWDTVGNLIWCSYYGGEDEEHSRGMSIDNSNNVYITAGQIAKQKFLRPELFKKPGMRLLMKIVQAFLMDILPSLIQMVVLSGVRIMVDLIKTSHVPLL